MCHKTILLLQFLAAIVDFLAELYSEYNCNGSILIFRSVWKWRGYKIVEEWKENIWVWILDLDLLHTYVKDLSEILRDWCPQMIWTRWSLRFFVIGCLAGLWSLQVLDACGLFLATKALRAPVFFMSKCMCSLFQSLHLSESEVWIWNQYCSINEFSARIQSNNIIRHHHHRAPQPCDLPTLGIS